MVSAQFTVAIMTTVEISSMLGLESLLQVAPAFPKKNLPMGTLLLILLSVSLLMSSWKQQQTHWALHGTTPMVRKMAMFVPGTLSIGCPVEATTTIWWSMA
jgi:hypothetical protein